MAKRKARRRIRGSGCVVAPSDRSVLYIKWLGKRMPTGMPNTPENKELLTRHLDRAYQMLTHEGLNIITPNTGALTMADVWAVFEREYLPSKAPKTVENYLSSFRYFFGVGHEPMNVENVTMILEQGMRGRVSERDKYHPSAKPFNATTAQTYLRGVKVFLTWAQEHRRKYLSDPINYKQVTARLASTPGAKPEIYKPSELSPMLAVLRSMDEEASIQAEMALVTGWRIHEIMELKDKQVDESIVNLVSKHGTQHEPWPIWSEAAPVIERALHRMREQHAEFILAMEGPLDMTDAWHRAKKRFDEGYIFERHDFKRDYKALLLLLNEAMKRAGVVKRGRAWHEFRKSFISRVLRSGMPLDKASKVCRCSIPTMMKYYRFFGIEELAGSLEAMKIVESRRITEGEAATFRS